MLPALTQLFESVQEVSTERNHVCLVYFQKDLLIMAVVDEKDKGFVAYNQI